MRIKTTLLICLVGLLVLGARGATPFTVFVVEGDSLFSSDNGLSNWTQFFPKAYGPLFNNAQGGDLMQNIVDEYATQDHPDTPVGTDWPHYFFLEGGIGDLFQISATGAQVYSNALTVLASSAADGYTNILCTVAPSALLSADQEAERQNYNALVRSGTNNGSGYRMLDVDSLISTNTGDARYYQPDGLHWSVEFEEWLGMVVIPAFINYSAPELTIDPTGTVSWASVAYATNTLISATALTTPLSQVVTNIVTQASSSQVVSARSCPQEFYRLRVDLMDFVTFYNLLHP